MRVLHLVGSPTSEEMAELSRLYAADCLRATADPAYDVTVAHVEPGGTWRFPTDLSSTALAAAEPLDLPAALRVVADLDPEVAVPQMFCLAGMTTYRSLLDALGVPFVGNTAEAMGIAAHKARAKAVVAGGGVRVPDGVLVRAGEDTSIVPLALPVVVKPVDADNSAGLTLVRSEGEYAAAVAGALEHSPAALVETYVELGREVRCGVLEVDGELVALPLEEYAVDRDTKPVRDAGDKLRRDGGDDGAPGALALVAKDAEHAWILPTDDPVTPAVHEAARRAHVALGCRDYSLFDFRVDADGRPWFLEAGLYCSYAEKSVVSVMAAAAGIALPDLFRAGVDQALSRGSRGPSALLSDRPSTTPHRRTP